MDQYSNRDYNPEASIAFGNAIRAQNALKKKIEERLLNKIRIDETIRAIKQEINVPKTEQVSQMHLNSYSQYLQDLNLCHIENPKRKFCVKN